MKLMKKPTRRLGGLAVLGAVLLAAQATAQEAPVFTSEKDQLSYALGMDLGQQLRRLAVDVDPGIFAKGLRDAFDDRDMLMSREEAQATIAALQEEMKNREMEKARLRAPRPENPGEARPVQDNGQ